METGIAGGMRLASVRIRSYRCLKDLEVVLDDYTALIGPNGSGKSSVLYALDWFLNGGDLSEEDLHRVAENSAATDIDVAVTFTELDAEDRRVLESYGRGAFAHFRRTWSSSTDKDKMIGNSKQGPGFATVRSQTRIGELRAEYATLRTTFPDLATVTIKEEILAELTRWEDDPANADQLEDVPEADATHMFGFNGEHTLAKRVRLVLVPAATDIVSQVGRAGRGSALSDLIGSLMSEAVTTARSSWEERFATQIQELADEIKRGVADSTAVQADRVNERLKDLVPNAKIEFIADAPSWSLKGDGSLNTDVIIDGMRNDVSRQGHGVQRAVMIAMLQALVPDAKSVVDHAEADVVTAPDPAAHEDRDALPALIIGIEEPEIYQHPVRARNFARVLSRLAERAKTQVFVATHSPYFVTPEQFTALRCFALTVGATTISTTTLGEVAADAGAPESQVTRAVEKELPRTFSEGFFADAVVFVEGDTDRVIYEVIADRAGRALDSAGIAVLAMSGKENMHVPFVILRKLGIPAYLVADCDALGAARKHSGDQTREEHAEASHKKATEVLLEWLPSATSTINFGALPYSYGDASTVASHYALWHDDLETELEKWPSFVAALTSNGGSLRKKDVAAYRAAAMEASTDDMPEIFGRLVAAIHDFKQVNTPAEETQ